MPYSEVAPIPKQMTIVVGLCVVGLMAFGLALSYYKNVLFDRQLLSMQERNSRLKGEISRGHTELQYLQSEQYKDKYAKENFGLVRPGEKVLVLDTSTEEIPLSRAEELTPEENEAVFEENLRTIHVVDHWKLYLFHHEMIEDLKKNI